MGNINSSLTLDEQLEKAVKNENLTKVAHFLEQGANPNCKTISYVNNFNGRLLLSSLYKRMLKNCKNAIRADQKTLDLMTLLLKETPNNELIKNIDALYKATELLISIHNIYEATGMEQLPLRDKLIPLVNAIVINNNFFEKFKGFCTPTPDSSFRTYTVEFLELLIEKLKGMRQQQLVNLYCCEKFSGDEKDNPSSFFKSNLYDQHLSQLISDYGSTPQATIKNLEDMLQKNKNSYKFKIFSI